MKVVNCGFLFFAEGRSCHPELSDGGAFQVSLSQLQLDFYPYHLATGDRSTWVRYNPDSSVHTGWLENSLKQFQTTLLESATVSLKSDQVKSQIVHHAPLSRTAGATPTPKSSLPNKAAAVAAAGDNVSDVLVTQFRKLMTTNLVVRLNNFTLWKVSTSKVKVQPKEFLSGKKDFIFFISCFGLLTIFG